MTAERERLDRLLVARGLFESRARAQEAIRAGLVSIDGRAVMRVSDPVARDARIEARAPHPYVSRGGLKLAAALDAFGLDPAGLACLDVGASTGGFTDLLLRRGAESILAVDVGRDQLHPSLRADARVTSLEGADIRGLASDTWSRRPRLAVIDVSFISLHLVLPSVTALLAEDCALVALIKPQFEAGRDRIGRGGLVRDEGIHAEVCAGIRVRIEELDLTVLGLIPSPVTGGDGNREFLIGARRGDGLG